jgi:glycosyltransferase involved in cell wall biosynthesis
MPLAAPRRKVLHLITRLITGGAQDNTLLTAELHDRDRYEVHLASGAHGELIPRARASADVFHPIPHLFNPIAPGNDLRALAEIVALLRRERFDVVHTHSSKAGYLGRLAGRLVGVPCVVHTIHGSPFHVGQPAWKRALYVNLERSARPLADYILTLSEHDRREFITNGIVAESRSRTVYTGMDPSRIVPSPGADRSQMRRQLGVPPGGHMIVSVGRHDRQKAPDLLVRAFRLVLNAHPQTVLVMVGDGPIRAEVEALASQLGVDGQVRFLGTRTDVPDLLAAADVFSFTSLREAMGRAMLEAMLAGLPVVVPRVSGIPEAARPGETGVLFEVGDVEGIADGLNGLLADASERRRLGQNARELVAQRFSARAMVDAIEEVYEHVLSGGA